jgi:hypothetical protein
MPTHRWRTFAHLLTTDRSSLITETTFLHSPGSSLFLVVKPLPPVTRRFA